MSAEFAGSLEGEELEAYEHLSGNIWDVGNDISKLSSYFYFRSRLDTDSKIHLDLKVVLYSSLVSVFDNLAADIILEHHSIAYVHGEMGIYEDVYFQELSAVEASVFLDFYVARYETKFGSKRNSRTTWGDEDNLLAIRNMAFVRSQERFQRH